VSALVTLGVGHHAQNQGARTESRMSYDKDGSLITTETDFDAENRLIEKRELKGGKVRKRIHFNYPKGFTKPNTSTTEYGSDGKVVSVKNDDVDKDGNPTSSVTTTYDAQGNETGGSKRVPDPKTGKDRCYKWDPKKGVYEEVSCPPEVAQSEPSGNSQNARVETGGGLQKVTFDTSPGLIHVYLPDDLRAGDTISGTVVAEPKGQTPEERARNLTELNGYVIELETPKKPDRTSNLKVKAQVMAPIPQLRVTLPPTNTSGSLSTTGTHFQGYELTVSMKTDLGKLVFVLPIEEQPQKLGPISVESHIYQVPTIGQQGRPSVITGPFDGNSSNTMLKWCINLTPACEQNPSTGGVIAPMAESPRKLVFAAPINVTGPIEIQLKEGNTETKGTSRNVGVDLSAPKTSLLKGESTTLAIHVSGLQGITEPVPLHLTKDGVVTMQGGDVQTISIKPAEVQSNGTYTTTRTITGVQTGVWNATATVVVFDFCLQDDTNGNLLTFSSTTGDYVFCQGRSTIAGPNPIALSTLNFLGTDFTGGVRVSAGDINESGGSPTSPVNIDPGASITKNGAITVADFNYKLGYIHVQIDDNSHTGSASGYIYQQITVPSSAGPKKINFTITDRDTRNNTCACK